MLLVIGLILIIGGIIVAVAVSDSDAKMGGGIALVVGLVLAMCGCLTVIPAGHVGVPVLFGKVIDYPLPEGLHFRNPLWGISDLSVRTETYTMSIVVGEGQVQRDDSITAISKDGLMMDMDLTLAYRLEAMDASWVYRNLGPQYVAKVVRPAIRTAIRRAAAQFHSQEAYALRREELTQTIEELMAEQVRTMLSDYPDFGERTAIVIQQVMLRNITLPQTVKTAIDAKAAAEHEAQKMDFVIAKERKEAERKRIEARGIADFQDIVTEGISDKLLQWRGIEATSDLAKSKNAKVIVIGSGRGGLPIILNPGS